jgi:hypothetical protein
MGDRDPKDIDREPADVVGTEPELHGIGDVDFDLEGLGACLSTSVPERSDDEAQQDHAKANRPHDGHGAGKEQPIGIMSTILPHPAKRR